MGRITGLSVLVSRTNLMSSAASLAIHSPLWGDVKAALHVSGRPSDVRLRAGASASTSGVSPVMTVAPVEVTIGEETGTP